MCALEPSQETYRILYEDNPSMYFAVAADGEVLSVNRYGADNLGYVAEELLGRPVANVFHPDDRQAVETQLALCCEHPGEVFEWQLRKVHRRGHIMWVYEQARAVRDASGAIIVLIVCEDITARREAEEALRQAHDEMERRVFERTEELHRSREHYRMLLESVNVIPWEMPAGAGVPTYVGPQAVELLGYPRADWYEKDFWESRVHPEDLPEALAFYDRIAETRVGGTHEYRMIDAEEGTVWFRDVVSVTVDDEGTATLRGFMIEVTTRKLAELKLRESESALRLSQQRLQDLTGRLLSAQEEERRHLAREIHDDLSQRLAGLANKSGFLEQAAARQQRVEPSQLQEIHTELIKLAGDVRTLSRGLHPSMLEHLGLEDALRWECRTFSERSGVSVLFSSERVPEEISMDLGLCLFRITQTALNNVERHAETDRASVTLIGTEDGLELVVEDEGVGFDPSVIRASEGIGLASMQERIRLVQGRLAVESSPGQGTRIGASVPLTPTEGLGAAVTLPETDGGTTPA